MYLLKTDVGLSQMRHLCSSIIILLLGLWYTIVGIYDVRYITITRKSREITDTACESEQSDIY